MKPPAWLSLAATIALAFPAQAQSPSLGASVHLSTGALLGSPRNAEGVLAFKGIPYAAPPVAALRWHAPQTALAWTGVRDATAYGPRCLSASAAPPETPSPESEDCLTLNVWTGAQQAKEKRPVLVWIHGGGFEFGSSRETNTEGVGFAAKGVVLVSLNYRLGVLGFLAHPELDREGPSGDYGLQDMQAALRWVQANIASFGGDPTNITIYGESAGAHAIGILMASPLSKGLFQKAVGSSGAFWDGEHGPLQSFQEAHDRGVRFAKQMGAKTIADLRALPAERVNGAAMVNFSTDPIVTAFSPNVDRYVVPEVPAARFLDGKQLRIPLLAGWNAHEDIPFGMWALPHQTAQAYCEAAVQVFGETRIDEFLKLYPASTDAQAKQSATELAGDMVIAQQTWEWLDLQRRTTHEPVYGYKFTYTSDFLPVATHASDVPFAFGTLIQSRGAPPSPAVQTDRAMANQFTSYLVNFAHSGDPNGPDLPKWPIFDGTTVLELGKKVIAASPAQIARFRFLSSFRNHGVLPSAWRDFPATNSAVPTAAHSSCQRLGGR